MVDWILKIFNCCENRNFNQLLFFCCAIEMRRNSCKWLFSIIIGNLTLWTITRIWSELRWLLNSLELIRSLVTKPCFIFKSEIEREIILFMTFPERNTIYHHRSNNNWSGFSVDKEKNLFAFLHFNHCSTDVGNSEDNVWSPSLWYSSTISMSIQFIWIDMKSIFWEYLKDKQMNKSEKSLRGRQMQMIHWWFDEFSIALPCQYLRWVMVSGFQDI